MAYRPFLAENRCTFRPLKWHNCAIEYSEYGYIPAKAKDAQ